MPQFTKDAALTALAIQYANPAQTLIADSVLPRSPVVTSPFKWHRYPEGANFTVPDTRVGARSAPSRVEVQGQEAEASTEAHGIDIPLDNDTIKKAETAGHKPRNQATELAADIIALGREVRVAALIQNPANYAAAMTQALGGTDQFSDVGSDPVGAISDMLAACYIRPNRLVMGEMVWRLLRRHPRIVKAVRGNDGGEGLVRREDVAALFEVRDVFVGESRVNINRPGQNAELARTWGNSLSGHYINPGAPASGGVTFGFTAQYGKRIAGTIQDPDMGVRGGIRVRVAEEVKELVVADKTGFLLTNVVAEGA